MVPDQTDRRKAPSSGLLGLSARSAAYAATPLRAVLRVRGQRPLPAGPTPASSANFLFSQFKVLLNFFQKIAGSRGRAPDALRTASRSEAFRAQPAEGGLLARDERGTPYPVKRIFRVNCRPKGGKRVLFASEKASFGDRNDRKRKRQQPDGFYRPAVFAAKEAAENAYNNPYWRSWSTL